VSWLESGPLRWVLFYDVAVLVTFVVSYGLTARWRSSAVGRHLMSFSIVVAAMVGIALSQNLFGEQPIWTWLLGFAALGAEATRRLYLLFKIQARVRHRRDIEGGDDVQ
jgi:hypothetical protein